MMVARLWSPTRYQTQISVSETSHEATSTNRHRSSNPARYPRSPGQYSFTKDRRGHKLHTDRQGAGAQLSRQFSSPAFGTGSRSPSRAPEPQQKAGMHRVSHRSAMQPFAAARSFPTNFQAGPEAASGRLTATTRRSPGYRPHPPPQSSPTASAVIQVGDSDGPRSSEGGSQQRPVQSR